MPEVKLGYRTSGSAKRNAGRQVVNAVLMFPGRIR
jgi:hypothetical protein